MLFVSPSCVTDDNYRLQQLGLSYCYFVANVE